MSGAVVLKNVVFYSFLKPWLGEKLQVKVPGESLEGEGKVLS
jgi:hypothetical protein